MYLQAFRELPTCVETFHLKLKRWLMFDGKSTYPKVLKHVSHERVQKTVEVFEGRNTFLDRRLRRLLKRRMSLEFVCSYSYPHHTHTQTHTHIHIHTRTHTHTNTHTHTHTHTHKHTHTHTHTCLLYTSPSPRDS